MQSIASISSTSAEGHILTLSGNTQYFSLQEQHLCFSAVLFVHVQTVRMQALMTVSSQAMMMMMMLIPGPSP